MRGPLLVADQDVLELGVLVEVLVDGQVRAAWVAEDVFDTFALQRFEDHVGSGHFWRAPCLWLKMKKPPPFGWGLLRSVWWFWLVRARPRSSEANKAQESKEEYEGQRKYRHCTCDVSEQDRA
jgi:hypothetical protein